MGNNINKEQKRLLKLKEQLRLKRFRHLIIANAVTVESDNSF